MADWSQGIPQWVRDRYSIQTAQCSHEGFLYWEGVRKRNEKRSASGFVGRERETEMQKERDRHRKTEGERHRETEGVGSRVGEKERERKGRGRRERKQTGVLPFKGAGTMQVHRDHTAGQSTACILGMHAGVKHSAKGWAGGLNAHKWYTVTLTCFFIVFSVKANVSLFF